MEDNQQERLHVSPGNEREGMRRKSNNPHSSPHEQRWVLLLIHFWLIQSGTQKLWNVIYPLQLAWHPYGFSLNVSTFWGESLCGMLSLVRREDAVTCWTLLHSTVVTAVSSRVLLLFTCCILSNTALPAANAGRDKVWMDVKRGGDTTLWRCVLALTNTHTHTHSQT